MKEEGYVRAVSMVHEIERKCDVDREAVGQTWRVESTMLTYDYRGNILLHSYILKLKLPDGCNIESGICSKANKGMSCLNR